MIPLREWRRSTGADAVIYPQSEPASLDVLVRPATPADARFMHQWRQEPSIRRFQPLADASLPQLRAEIAAQRIQDLYRGRGDRFQWVVLVAERPAGWITMVLTNWEHGLAEIGYALSSEYQRQGIMQRALEQILAELFLRAPLERIEARCAVGNTASQRVLERMGFTREGRLRGYFVLDGVRVDNYLYAILRSDYLQA
jgi:RimJ/RimL family protein N-acetyltransferase